MSAIISIIIPCYNSGEFISETLESINLCDDKNVYEIIIINDGSSDSFTLDILNKYSSLGYTVIHQENKGPAAARNQGVKVSKGDYLLFLDSDNKLKSGYIDQSLKILKKHKEVGVVYSNPYFFGDTSEERFETKKFDLNSILLYNYIDMCSVVRKIVWEELGGFDENRILIGHEDWEFWIRVGSAGWKFHHINQKLFDYRIRNNSLITQATEITKYNEMFSYIFSKHSNVYISAYTNLLGQYNIYLNDQKSPFRSFLKYTYNKYLKGILRILNK